MAFNAKKIKITNQPKFGDESFYNFELSDTTNDYQNTIGKPTFSDKFSKKDLYTNSVGDELNEKIIQNNLFFEGVSDVAINNLYISNNGVDGTVKNVRVAIWLFSEKAYGKDPSLDGYSSLKNKLFSGTQSEFKIYDSGFGNRSSGEDIGHIEEVENQSIISNFGSLSSEIETNTFTGGSFNSGSAFDLSPLEEEPSVNKLFNEEPSNPIYIVIYKRGDKRVAWPINTDNRRQKFTIYKINNQDLFIKSGQNFAGKNNVFNFDTPYSIKQGEGGGGARQAAWSVTQFRMTISTVNGQLNNFSNVSQFTSDIPKVLPPLKFSDEQFFSFDFLSSLHPSNQLQQNGELSQVSGSGISQELLFPDFDTITQFGVADMNNNLTELDLQSYYDDEDLSQRASAPAGVSFKLNFINTTDDTNNGPDFISNVYAGSTDDDGDGEPEGIGGGGQTNDLYYYFTVIDWDDKEDKFKTIEDFLNLRPQNTIDWLNKQQQGLYLIQKSRVSDSETIENNIYPYSKVYTTPGIKNVKILVIQTFSDVETGPTLPEPYLVIGRWKLVNARFFLDIPVNQYPDFSEVGGDDYKTIPWPFTTPIIGGIDENSKYSKSVKNVFNSGKIADDDIIDEKFLIKDIQNDELGKSINNMDLEQIRYFNRSYDIYDLLNIPKSINSSLQPNTSPDFLATLPFPIYRNEFDCSDAPPALRLTYADVEDWIGYGRPDIGNFIKRRLDFATGIGDDSLGDIYSYPNYIYNYYLGSGGNYGRLIYETGAPVPNGNSLGVPSPQWEGFVNNEVVMTDTFYYANSHNDSLYWDASSLDRTLSRESSVGQIFINDNQSYKLKESCKIEINTGELTGKSIFDSSGNGCKGLLIGDYKIKKTRKGEPMRRDSFITLPKYNNNKDGAL